MRICLIGDFSGNSDEGMKNVSKSIKNMLSLNHEVFAVRPKEILKIKTVSKIKLFKPQIIHYLHGPTIRSLTILRIANILTGNRAKTVSSATKPYFGKISKRFIPMLKPDVVLTQSKLWEDFFKQYNFPTEFFPNGIDCNKFHPATKEQKKTARKEFGLDADKFVVLHVGHIRKNRNLEVFVDIQKIDGIQVFIVGSNNLLETDIKNKLLSAGCKINHQYIKNIEKVYHAADLFVFPTQYSHKHYPSLYNEIGAIDIPLSVLEAMACNLPVVSTPFGALPRMFNENSGLLFREGKESLKSAVTEILSKIQTTLPNTREQALLLSWSKIICKLEGHYKRLVSNE